MHGFAASRCGINNVLYVHEMSPDGFQVLDKGRRVYDGSEHGDVTVEGPKLYRRNGTYWILCPAGGVKPGYQLAMRAENVYGPYERRVVLSQGGTPVNGPHQGGWFDDGKGRDWFIHFQDVEEYGRVPHLQPVDWSDGWPVMGDHGEPVAGGDTGLPERSCAIPASDDFAEGLGLQWQWQANPRAAWYTETRPGLRLHCAPAGSLFHAGQFLSQLMQCRDFDMDLSLRLHAQAGDRAGIGMMGYTYHYLAVDGARVCLVRGEVREISRWEEEQVTETVLAEADWPEEAALLRMRVRNGQVSFAFGPDAEHLTPLGGSYPMTCGGWTGARPGIFAMNTAHHWGGWADVDRCEVRRV